ncbi:hypothetical protein [Streptomyces varsoviensis]|uniref:hypothetical protein n=1 Tax=Streptomyces varsoviensis TaxID=67373 RepID=UPI0004C662FB|nr:hypothetical protein [Streptomyces varsoviensis]
MPTPISYDRAVLARLVRRQHGLATHAQLRALGVSQGAIWNRARENGPWQRVLPRVYLLHSGAPDTVQRLLAAVLYAAGQRAAAAPLSGRSALLTGRAALHMAPGSTTRHEAARLAPVEVLIPDDRRVVDAGYVRVIRTRRWPARHLLVDSMPITGAARAAADTAARWTGRPNALRAILTTTVQRDFCTAGDLVDELSAAGLDRVPTVALAAEELTSGVTSWAMGHARKVIAASPLPPPLWHPDLYTPTGHFIASPDAYWPRAGVALVIPSPPPPPTRLQRLTPHAIHVLTTTPTTLRHTPTALITSLTEALKNGHRSAPPRGIRVETE